MPVGSNVFVPEPEAIQILKCYNIRYPEHGLAKNPEEAVAIAEKVGYPVALKIVSPDVIHKSEVGGVLLGIKEPDTVRSGFDMLVNKMEETLPRAEIHGILVNRECEEGLETIIGAIRDPVFGPTVMAGLGGIFTEVMKDITFRIAPLKKIDAEEMIEEMKGYKILKGIRGQAPRDIKIFIETILSVSRLIMENDDIVELDLNPVRLYEKGLDALDVRMIKYGESKKYGNQVKAW